MAIKRRKLTSGTTRYEVVLFQGIEPGTGKRLETSKTFRTFAEARRWETERRRALDTGTYVEPSQTSLGEYLDGWLDGAVKLRVRARTLAGYRAAITVAVKRHEIARVPLARLTPGLFEQFYTDLATKGPTGKRGLASRSVRAIHALVRSALRTAVRDRLLLGNPTDAAELPARAAAHDPGAPEEEGGTFRALSREQVRKLLDVSASPPPAREGMRKNGKRWRYQPPGDRNRWHALWHLLVNGGLRPSEALGLKWEDVEWEKRRVRIVKALVEPLRRGAGWSLEPPKTKRSRRVVELPPETIEALQWHRVQQEAEKLAAGDRYQDHGFLFAGERGDPLALRNLKRRHWWPLLDAAGLPRLRPYDLRHTHATLLLGAGVPVHVVSQRLGHASAKMTLDVYANYLPDQHEEALSRYKVYLDCRLT